MSLDIDQIALHQLIKRDEQNLELVLRESLLEPNATVVEMMAELHRVYSAKSKAYGLFNEESELAQYEWIKVYGVLFGCTDKTDKLFDAAVAAAKK